MRYLLALLLIVPSTAFAQPVPQKLPTLEQFYQSELTRSLAQTAATLTQYHALQAETESLRAQLKAKDDEIAKLKEPKK